MLDRTGRGRCGRSRRCPLFSRLPSPPKTDGVTAAPGRDPGSPLDPEAWGLDLQAPTNRALAVLRWIVSALMVVTVAWLSFTRNGWVPFLSGVDLGVHEFGHLLFAWAPFLVVATAGSAVQVAAPMALASYFWWRGDRLGAALLLGWLGMSLHNVAVYVGDAQRMVLPLFGDDGSGAGHDWHNILGALGLLQQTDVLAGLVTAAAALAFLGSLGLVAWWAWQDLRPAPRPAPSTWRLPVRQRR